MSTPYKFREARIIPVLEVVTCEGVGVLDDPFREVVHYVDLETGRVLAVSDPCREGAK